MRIFRSVRYYGLYASLVATVAVMGCGSNHEALVSITIAPPAGSATAGSAADTVQFTTTGNFDNSDALGGAVCANLLSPDKSRVLDNANWMTSDSVNTSIDVNGLAKCLGATGVPAKITAVVSSGFCGGVKGTATLTCD